MMHYVSLQNNRQLRYNCPHALVFGAQIDRAARRDAAAAKHGVEHRVMLTRADARASHDAAAQSQEPSFGIDGDASGRILSLRFTCDTNTEMFSSASGKEIILIELFIAQITDCPQM